MRDKTFSMWDVVFYEIFKEEKVLIKKFLPRRIRAKFIAETIQESFPRNLPASLIISVRTQSKIPADWLHPTSGLKGVLTRSAGYDHVFPYQKKISCGYLPEYCARACAEQAMLMVVALLRKLPRQIKNFQRFHRDDITGYECRGKKVLVVGVGRIGREVVDIARGLRMQVRGVDLVKREKNLEYVALRAGISWGDMVVCALPLTEKTRGIFDARTFSGKKKGLVFVNVSRGELSPLADMKRLLDVGILSGMGLDVFEDEPRLAESLRKGQRLAGREGAVLRALQKKDNVILTPHNSFNTHESTERKARQSATAIVQFLERGTFSNPVPAE